MSNNAEKEAELIREHFYKVADILLEHDITAEENIDYIVYTLIYLKYNDKELFDVIMNFVNREGEDNE